MKSLWKFWKEASNENRKQHLGKFYEFSAGFQISLTKSTEGSLQEERG
jgi:hypothetical protein